MLDVHERSGSSALPAILLGAAAAVATVLGLVWFVRRHDRLSRPVTAVGYFPFAVLRLSRSGAE